MQSTSVKPGYQVTELGVIPDDWEVIQLQDVSKLSSGTTPSRAEFDLYFKAGTNHWVKTTDLTNSWINKTEEQITNIAVSQTNLSIYPKNTIFIAMYGGFNQIGRTGILNVQAACNQALIAIQAKPNLLSPRYLLSYLNFKVDYWKNVASSSRKDPNITSKDVRQFSLPLPPLPEQKAIAAALSDVDALIAAQDALIAKKRDIKTATMQQLLTGKVRLGDFGQRVGASGGQRSDGVPPGYQQTELGVIPEDWVINKLSKLLKESPKYGINAAAVTYNGKLPTYIRITDISEDGYFKPSEKVCVNHDQSDLYNVCKGDILLARTGASVGKSYIYREDDGELVYAGFLIKVSPDNSKLLSDYLFQYLKTSHYWSWVTVMSMRSGQPGINGNEYGQLLIPTPPLPEQKAIATVLSDMDAEITALEAQRDKTRAIKQGMMQELLTGRTRLV